MCNWELERKKTKIFWDKISPLYSVKGRGLSYDLMSKVESSACDLGYKRMYLETHDNLKAAIHLYEKCGYKEIERPKTVVHSTMNRFFLKELENDIK